MERAEALASLCPRRDLKGSTTAKRCPLANAMTSGEQARPPGYREPVEDGWDIPSAAPLATVGDRQTSLVKRSRRRVVLTSVAVVGLLLGALKVLWPVAGTLGATEVGPWDVRINSGSTRSVVVVAYGREAGLHLMRVPASSGRVSSSAMLSARIGESPLYMISLGRAPLEVSSIAPNPVQSWKARGRVIKAFKDDRGTGVRAW